MINEKKSVLSEVKFTISDYYLLTDVTINTVLYKISVKIKHLKTKI